MRKYFLFTAVALLAATNVNADKFGTVNVNATVEQVTRITCSALELGTIYIDSSKGSSGSYTINLGNAENIEGAIVRVDDTSQPRCTFGGAIDISKVEIPSTLQIEDVPAGNVMNITLLPKDYEASNGILDIEAEIEIDADFDAGDYTTSFNVFYID